MTKRYYLFFIFLMPTIMAGQQRPLFSQYFHNKYYDNPAYGGMTRSLQVDAVYRDQYSGFIGHPTTIFAGFHLPVYKIMGGTGFQLMRQTAGVYQNIQASGSYNYVMGTSLGFLSFGSRIGLNHIGFSGDQITTPEGNYEGTIQHNDPVLEASPFSGTGVFWELGVYFMAKEWEAGLTIYDFPEHSSRLGLASYSKTSGFHVFGQYSFRYNDYLVIPNAIFRSDFREFQTEIGVALQGMENFYGGISFRGYNKLSIDALVFTIGTKIGTHYKLSYSYDLGLSDLRNVNDGSHEILLSYNLNKAIGLGLPPKIIHNPRHL